MAKEKYLSIKDSKDFIKTIKPFIERIRLAKEGRGRISNPNHLKDIANIYNKHVKDPAITYGLNIGCNNCINSAIHQILGRYDIEIGRQSKGKKITFPKQESLTEQKVVDTLVDMYKEGNTTIVVDPSLMKWGAFKKYCTSKGIKVTGKNRKKLKEELKGL